MRRLRLLLTVLLVVAAACGGGSDDGAKSDSTSTPPRDDVFVVNVASYEPVADVEQRFIVGLTGEEGTLVAFGEVDFEFSYLGTKERKIDPPQRGPEATARFLPIPGQPVAPKDAEPELVPPSKGIGVYGAEEVIFGDAGFWQVEVTAELAGERHSATGAFEVFAEHRLPAPGDPAPRTKNHVWGSPDVPAKAIDSRAEEGGDDPAPELHSKVIADVIAARRPLLVVVATPVYCQSRFCGPITDMAQQLAKRYGDRMDFVHLEVFKDFEANAVNAAAAEWALVPGGGMTEPWTYLVGADGVIVERWDNVASEAEVATAIEKLLAS